MDEIICESTIKAQLLLPYQDAGVDMDKIGAIKVDEYSHTNVPSIYAVGDVTNRMNLTPVALMEGMALSHTLFGSKPTKPDYKNVASAVFCQPPLATVGLSEEQAIAELSGDLDVYVSKFKPMVCTFASSPPKSEEFSCKLFTLVKCASITCSVFLTDDLVVLKLRVVTVFSEHNQDLSTFLQKLTFSTHPIKTLMKMIVHAKSDKVVGVQM